MSTGDQDYSIGMMGRGLNMGDSNEKQCQATDPKTLREQIMDCRVGKNEREWWASHEIEKLEEKLSQEQARSSRLREALIKIASQPHANFEYNDIMVAKTALEEVVPETTFVERKRNLTKAE